MKIDRLVAALRNRLPGQPAAVWMAEIRGLGQQIARVVVRLRVGVDLDGEVSAADLVWHGMDEALAAALVPEPAQEASFFEAYARLAGLREAARQVAAPDVLDALPEAEAAPPAHIEEMGEVLPVFAAEFLAVDEARELVPDFERALEGEMAALAERYGPPAPVRPEVRLRKALEEAGWVAGLVLGRILLLFQRDRGVVVLAARDAGPAEIQDLLDRIVHVATPLIQVAVERGGHPVYVLQPTPEGDAALLDGRLLPAEVDVARCIPEAQGMAAALVRSVVGLVQARTAGVELPAWAPCPHCGSPRAEVARFEVERGISTVAVHPSEGPFQTGSGRWLRVVTRKASRSQVVGRVIRCPDCLVFRPFPGDEPLPAGAIPRRMAGEALPRGIDSYLGQLCGVQRPLADEPVPDAVDEWAAAAGVGTAQYPDLRLVLRTAFRLPDQLADLARTNSEIVQWRAAAERLGRDRGTLLAWELRDLGTVDDGVRRVVVLAMEPEHAAQAAEAWFGPVEDWIPVTASTCWRGRILGARVPLEIVIIQDFLGAPGAFDGGELDYEFLTGIVQRAQAVVYVGDGREAWDDEGIQWAADEGRLAAVVAPAAQLARAARPDGVAWIDAGGEGVERAVIDAVNARVDPQTRLALKAVRDVIDELERALPRREMADHLLDVSLRTLAVQAELSGSPDRWFVLWDAILDRLATEGRAHELEHKVRASQAAKRLADLGLPGEVADSWWQVVDFYERTGVGRRLVRWIAPALRTYPDPILVERIRAVALRMPDLVARYRALRELRARLADGAAVDPKPAVLEFWWGCGAPWVWAGERPSLPDLLSFAPSALRDKSTVFIGGPSLRSAQRLAVLLSGLHAVEEPGVPNPGSALPAVVVEPAKVDLVRLQIRDAAGHFTAILHAADPRRWEGCIPRPVGIVPLTPELSAKSPPVHVMARRLPMLDEAQLAEVCALMHTVQYAAGEVVVAPGPVGGAAWIRSGSVRMYGRLAGTDALLAGELLFDESAAAEPIVAEDDLVLDVISRSAVRCLAEAGRDAIVAIEHAIAATLARLLGPGAIEPAWFTPRVLKPRAFNGDWKLFWPLVQRAGLYDVDPTDVHKLFPEARAMTLDAMGVIYEPHVEATELMLILDGTVVVDDGHGKAELGPGRLVGTLGMLEDPGHERCMTRTEATLLYLGDAPGRIWETRRRGFRNAMIATLRDRLVAAATGD